MSSAALTESLRIEQPTTDDGAGSSGRPSWCFPLNFSCCCPCLPTSVCKIQDWLHLVLIVGVFATILLLIKLFWEIGYGPSCDSPVCIKQIVSIICIIPSTIYFIQTIGRYDEQLRDKKQKHEHAVEGLVANINEHVAELNELCRQVTENANHFAVGRFNDKRDQFQRFLKNLKTYHGDLYTNDLLEEFRKYVVSWFQIFSGSMFQGERPASIEEEIRRCKSADEICDVALKRLVFCKIDVKVSVPAEVPLITGDSSRYLEDAEAGDAGRTRYCAGGPGYCGASWLQCCTMRCGRQLASSSTGMPITAHLGLCSVRILSRTHANLLFAFLVDIALMIFEAASLRRWSFALLAINEICVISVLGSFEAINEIAQLERKINIFQTRNAEIARRRDEMKANWERVMQLQDLWLYRTLPCLSIMGRVHNHLADETMVLKEAMVDGSATENSDERQKFLKLANDSLASLEQKLGSVESWRIGGPLDEEWKANMGKQLKDCESEQDLNQLLTKLPVLTNEKAASRALPPSTAELASSGAKSSRSVSPRP